ncbi:MAG: hypothetical protein AB7Q27_11670 [Acidimicrobiia bacterium]
MFVSDTVPVPLRLRRDLDWFERTTPRRLAIALLRIVGAPHVDSDALPVQYVFCELAEDIAEARRKGNVLPDSEHLRRRADEVIEALTFAEVIQTAEALRLQRREVRCRLGQLEAELRRIVVGELLRLMLRSTTSPPGGRRRRAA